MCSTRPTHAHVVAVPPGFACDYIRDIVYSIKIHSGVSGPWGIEIRQFQSLWLLAFPTACILLPYKGSWQAFI